MAPTNDKKLQCLLFAPPSIGSFECMGGKKYGLDTSAAVALFINYRHGSTCGDLKMRILMDRDHASYATDWSENGQAPVVPRHNIRITWDDMEFVKVKAIRVNSETHAKVLPREFVAASIAKNKIKWTHLRVKLTDAFRVGAGQRKLQFRQWAFLNCGEFNFLLEGHAVIASLRRFDRATFVREQEVKSQLIQSWFRHCFSNQSRINVLTM